MDIMGKKRNAEIMGLKEVATQSNEMNIRERAIDALSAYGTHEAIDAIKEIICHAGSSCHVKEYGLNSIREIRYLNIST
jgi:hypothetical protein